MNARTDLALDPRLESLLEQVEWARALAGRLVADAARADDVVQSALASAAKSLPRDATNLRGWVGEVVRNAARGIGREELRRSQRERTAAKPEAVEGADELVARAEMSRDLAQHVLALEPIYRDVVLLRWYEGLAPRDIAKKLGIPVATVNTRLARAHGELRTRLDRAYGDRANWCTAFAPFAVMPKATAPIGAIAAAMSVLLLAGAVSVLAWRASMDESRVVMLSDGTFIAVDADGVSLPLPTPVDDPSTRSNRVDTASSSSRASVAPAKADSQSTSTLPSIHVEGRAIGLDGRAIAGLSLRARDPSLPRIADGWLRVGNHSRSVDARALEEWRSVPPALEHTLAEYGGPIGLREVLLGADLSVTTTTSAEGRFVFDVLGSEASIDVSDEHHVVLASGRVAGEDGPTLLVSPTVHISGSVVDAQGLPVEGARIEARGVEAAIGTLPFEFEVDTWAFREDVKSDAAGRFDLGRTASFPGARLVAIVNTQFAADVELPTSDTRHVVLVSRTRMEPPKPRVRGVVLDARGVGIADASIRLGGAGAQTDQAGQFEFEAGYFAPESELVVLKRGLSPAWILDFGRTLRERGSVEDVEIRLASEALAITGRAFDAEGRALANWIVSLADTVKYPTMGIPLEFAAAGWYGNEQQPETDESGRFRLEGLAPQHYRVRLTDRETAVAFTSDPILAGARDVEIRLPADVLRSEIRGRTVSTLGVPVADVEVRVIYTIREQRGSTSWSAAQSTRSDSDGEFEFEDVPRRGLKLSVGGKQVRNETIVIPDDVDPNDVVVTVTVERRFQLEVDDVENVDQFEIHDRSGKALSIDGQFANSLSGHYRMPRDGKEFPVCTVSEEGVTIVLYSGKVEVRRALIVWSRERIQVLRP